MLSKHLAERRPRTPRQRAALRALAMASVARVGVGEGARSWLSGDEVMWGVEG